MFEQTEEDEWPWEDPLPRWELYKRRPQNNKIIKSHIMDVNNVVLNSQTLYECEFPGTMKNFYIEMAFITKASGDHLPFDIGFWALAVTRPLETITAGQGNWEPVQRIIASGTLYATENGKGQQCSMTRVHAKTSRKVQTGDRLNVHWVAVNGLKTDGSSEKYLTTTVTCWIVT